MFQFADYIIRYGAVYPKNHNCPVLRLDPADMHPRDVYPALSEDGPEAADYSRPVNMRRKQHRVFGDDIHTVAVDPHYSDFISVIDSSTDLLDPCPCGYINQDK